MDEVNVTVGDIYSADKTFLLRIPRVLHSMLKQGAREKGVSLHEYILAALDGAIKEGRDEQR